MIEHPNLQCTNPVHIFAGAFAGMTRFRPLPEYGMPSALYRTRTLRTQWVTRVPVRAVKIPGWLVRELPTSGRLHGGTKARETESQGTLLPR